MIKVSQRNFPQDLRIEGRQLKHLRALVALIQELRDGSNAAGSSRSVREVTTEMQQIIEVGLKYAMDAEGGKAKVRWSDVRMLVDCALCRLLQMAVCEVGAHGAYACVCVPFVLIYARALLW